MKRFRALVSAVFLVTIWAPAAIAAQPSMVISPCTGSKVAAPAADPELVVRQRLVTVSADFSKCQPGDHILVSLFENLTLSLRVESVLPRLLGSLIVRVSSPDDDEAGGILAVGSETVAGSFRVAGHSVQIRPLQDAVHVVRELPVLASQTASLSIMTPLYMEWQTAALVNVERRAVGLPPLAWDNLLFTAARGHSDDMATHDYFSHTALNGSTPGDRITAAGYVWNTCGENIAAGYQAPEAVVEAWMNSPGHRANILNTSFCDIGVGYAYVAARTYGHYWTQNFGRKAGVSVCPTPTDPPWPGTDGLSAIGWVASFYVAYWGRSPDPEGRGYWVDKVTSGTLTAAEVAENFALSDEAKALYAYFQNPGAATDADRREFVRQVYLNLLNREPDAAGLDYWTGALTKGLASPGQVIGHIIYAAMANHVRDWAVLRNKVDVGQYFADRVAQKGLEWSETLREYAVAVLTDVTEDLGTVSQSIGQVDALLGGRP